MRRVAYEHLLMHAKAVLGVRRMLRNNRDGWGGTGETGATRSKGGK